MLRKEYVMKKQNNLTIMTALYLAMAMVISLGSCSKWDEFKGYIEDGEITYVGKLDSVSVFSGDERVKLVGLLKPDPKINEVRVFWNDMKDSIAFELGESARNAGVFEQIISVDEGVISFEVITYDYLGNRSVTVPVVGRAYGPRYSNGLNNRLVSSAVFDDGVARIDWAEMDLSAGPFATEVKYVAADGEEKVRRVLLDEMQTILEDIGSSKYFSYRTLFLPTETSIDTFETAFVNVGVARDVTAEYLKNTKQPIEASSSAGRWGIPKDWVTNEAVKNYSEGGQKYGGVDFWGPYLAMEAGWSGDNMATIANGKIYQTVLLPAGDYTVEMDIPDCTAGGDFYTVAAQGTLIPDTENIGASLGFLKTNSPGTHKLNFSLDGETQVSIGFVGNLANKGPGDGTFWRITGVRLKQTLRIE